MGWAAIREGTSCCEGVGFQEETGGCLPKSGASHTQATPATWQGGCRHEATRLRDKAGPELCLERAHVGVLQGWAHSREIGVLGGDKHPVFSGQPGPICYHLLDSSAHQPRAPCH